MNVARRPEPRVGPDSGGDGIADQPDGLPSKRSDVRQVVENHDVLTTQLMRDVVEIDCIPVHDRCGDQTCMTKTSG